MSKNKSIRARGRMFSIGNIVELGGDKSTKFLEVQITMEENSELKSFYLTETKETPRPFQMIRKNFEEQRFKIGEQIQFDYIEVISSKGVHKNKIWSIYNRTNGLEKENR